MLLYGEAKGSIMNESILINALDQAVRNAIKEIGLASFKRTSFFMSNRQKEDLKAA